MTIQQAMQQLRSRLFPIYDEREANNIADWVMEDITGLKKIDRVVNKQVFLSAAQKDLLQNHTSLLLVHTPVQYVLHKAWFYGMELYVDENVLVPRPETEELVDWLIKDLPANTSASSIVLDIGTGSGCIALAVKRKLTHANVYACDISENALQIAQSNANQLHAAVQFHLVNILDKAQWPQLPNCNIIVSNPPYIPEQDKSAMADNVLKYEPHLALFVNDNNPLQFYDCIADFAMTHLLPNGTVYFEIHEQMGRPVTDLLQQKRFTSIELRKDLQGRDRMIKARL